MDAIRRTLQQISAQLSKLTATQKLLLGCVAVIAVMTLFLVSQYAGAPKLVDLTQTDDAASDAEFLLAKGIDAEVKNGTVHVPAEQRRLALSKLAEDRRLPTDSTLLFSNLVDNLKWTDSREQNMQKFAIAVQNELSIMLTNFESIRGAKVVIDVPQPRGIGVIVREPSASVSVTPEGGMPLKQRTVDAIASTVAGAIAGLDPMNVVVVDTANGIRHQLSEDDMGSGAYLELASAAEKKKAATIQSVLSYIPGVAVAVTAEVDNTRENSRTKLFRTPDEGGTVTGLATSDEIKTQKTTSEGRGAEPGFGSNVTADINRGSSGGTSSETSESRAELMNYVGEEVTEKLSPKGMPTRFAASINIPESFIVLALTGGDESADKPDAAAITARFEQEKLQIETSVLPHLRAGTVEGEVTVNLVPDTGPMALASIQNAGFGGAAGGVGGMLGLPEGTINTLLVGGAALMALCMMVFMVRRAGKEPPMPSAEELVGIPPPLETTKDLIGEADEGDMAMEGIEVDAEDIERQQMLAQLTQMVGDDPESTANLLNRWISVEE